NPAELAGEEGTVLELKVKKGKDGKVQDYKITRAKYSNVRPETLTWVNSTTAMLKVPTFDVGYNRKRVEDLMTEAGKAKNLILDLRSNPGGAVINLTHLMGLLLPEGTPIGTFISRSTVSRFVKERGGSPTDLVAIAHWSPMKLKAQKNEVPVFKGNVAVLINGGSGSASEIAAAALKESLNAPLIGTKSAGAVLVSVMAPMPHGYMLQYPITDYITMQGLRLEGNGVQPVVEAPAAVRFGEPDVAVEKAVILLQRAELRQGRDGK
ncbi:MAG TPA: S41 family peptidase, partial [Fimbriimonadaceae bacterium]|nr:S41 family peptidase [Fimbriimonadaceae bacterium]